MLAMKFVLLAIAASTLGGAGLLAPGNPGQNTTDVSFKEKVMPILKQNCVGCHSGDRAAKGLRLDTYDNVMKGANYGKVIKPGKSAESVLVKSIKGQPGGDRMPPGRRPMLGDGSVKTITDWIDQGAKNN